MGGWDLGEKGGGTYRITILVPLKRLHRLWSRQRCEPCLLNCGDMAPAGAIGVKDMRLFGS